MGKIKFMLILAGFLSGLNAVAFDFEYEGLYYKILSTEEKTVEVTRPTDDNSDLGYTGEIVIPEYAKFGDEVYTVISVGERAFIYCDGITAITISNTVKTIESLAFQFRAKNIELHLGNSVEYIGDYSFRGISLSNELVLPSSLKYIGSYAFDGLNASIINIPSNVEFIGIRAFQSDSIQEYNVDSENRNYCSIDGVLFDKDATTIISYPMARGDIHYKVPEGITAIGEWAFYAVKNLQTIDLPDSLTSIENCGFYGCHLKSIVIPDNVNYIGQFGFSECIDLVSIEIPELIDRIEWGTFIWCFELQKVTCKPLTPPYCNYWAFYDWLEPVWNTPLSKCTLYVPEESLELYMATFQWNEFGKIIGLPSSTGVESVNGMEDSHFSVYNLRGVNILNTTDKSEIQELPSGVYIINGKKVAL